MKNIKMLLESPQQIWMLEEFRGTLCGGESIQFLLTRESGL